MNAAHVKNDKGPAFSAKVAVIVGVWLLIFGIVFDISEVVFGFPIRETFSLSRADVWMIVVGGLAFLAMWGALEKWLFAPYIQVTEAREGATVGAGTKAEDTTRRAQQLLKAYDDTLAEQRAESMAERLSVLDKARKEAAKITAAAEDKAAEAVSVGRAKMNKETEELRGKINQQADTLVEEIVSKVTQPTRGA